MTASAATVDERERQRARRSARAAGQLQLRPARLGLLRVLPPLLLFFGSGGGEREGRRGEEGDGLAAVRVRQSGEDGDAPRLDRNIQVRNTKVPSEFAEFLQSSSRCIHR